MLLHRLFSNRLQVADGTIEALVGLHVAEHIRLQGVPAAEHERRRRDFVEAWPFAPHLLRLLEEQVLIATDAQETRDMIRILANLYKSRGEAAPVLTAADFRLDDDTSGIGALLDSVANEHHRTLRTKAQQNIIAVTEAVFDHATLTPHLQEVMGALWLRSVAVGNLAGADPATLQVDATRDKPIDDNAFQVELATIEENSFNIHREGTRLVFREEENPRAKILASAKNERLFADGSDLLQLAKQVRYVVGGSEEVAKEYRVIALPQLWKTDPWSQLEESERPEHWDERVPILVLPEAPDKLEQRLGTWLKDHLQKRRNTIRFVLPKWGSTDAFLDRELLILARATMKAQEWGAQNPEYRSLHREFENALRENLKKRFDRFAVLHRWNYADPTQCRFSVETLTAQGSQIPDGIEETLTRDLFVPEDFEALVLEAAANNASLGKLLRELQEPRPGGQDCVPWLGEPEMKDRILRLCARGKIAINLRGLEYLQASPGEGEDAAWKRLRSKLSYTGRQLDEVFLLEPSAVPATGGSNPTTASPPAPGPIGGLFPGGASPPTPAPEPIAGPGYSIFGGTTGAPPKGRVSLSNPPTSPLNLIGKLEGWGIGSATQVAEVSLKVSAASGAQLKEILKRLPDGMTFEISLQKDEE
jgi:hypothetical protein